MRFIFYAFVVASSIGLATLDFNFSVVKRIDNIFEFAKSVRNYVSREEFSEAADFPFNVPSYFAVNVMNEMNIVSEDANYKEVSLNPVNMNNLAIGEDEQILKLMALNRESNYRLIYNSGFHLNRYDPIFVKDSCLKCHGTLKDAPAEQIARYGSESGLHYKLDDLYGLKVVSVNIDWFLARYLVFAVLVMFPTLYWVRSFNDKIERAMNVDSMSGAFNKNYYIKTKHELKQGYFILIDIDDFKMINDMYGHHYGDMAIRQLCKILKDRCREEDNLYRFGGEEFILFMDGKICKERLAQFLDCVIDQIKSEQFGDENTSFGFTISAGVSVKRPEDGIDEVMARADKALYYVKNNGKNSYSINDTF